MSILIPVVILSGLVLYLMTADERLRLVHWAIGGANHLTRRVLDHAASDKEFQDSLRARTRLALAAPAVAFACAATFAGMVMDPGPVDSAGTLIEWGGNFAPRTTNGEWWRLVASTFVHAGPLHLAATLAGLLTAGLVLERLVGPTAFLSVYWAAGAFAGLVSLSQNPIAIGVGASGAVFGIYGLLIATALWGRAAMPVTRATLNRMGAAAAVFLLYNVLTSNISLAGELTGLATGLAAGLLLDRRVVQEKPPPRRVAFAFAVTLLVAAVWAVPLRGTADIRPALEGVLAVETRTAAGYRTKVGQFQKGQLGAGVLVETIEGTILPDLQAARAQLAAVQGVPREHLPLVTAAEEYFRLREQAWRLRAEGLSQSSMKLLREADAAERNALSAFGRIAVPGGG